MPKYKPWQSNVFINILWLRTQYNWALSPKQWLLWNLKYGLATLRSQDMPQSKYGNLFVSCTVNNFWCLLRLDKILAYWMKLRKFSNILHVDYKEHLFNNLVIQPKFPLITRLTWTKTIFFRTDQLRSLDLWCVSRMVSGLSWIQRNDPSDCIHSHLENHVFVTLIPTKTMFKTAVQTDIKYLSNSITLSHGDHKIWLT